MSEGLERFFPGYFALVMATGIVSLAAHLCGLPLIPEALLWMNIAAYGVLWGITLARLVRFPRAVLADLRDHARGPGFLTLVAGTCVLGSQCAILRSWADAAAALFVLGLGLWAVILYAFCASVTVVEPKPTLQEGINGSWLLLVVSTESLCVLGPLVAPGRPEQDLILFISLIAYLAGAMLYLLVMPLMLYRWMFFSMAAESLTPPYWINMGALAISTLAGSRLLLSTGRLAFLQEIAPFLKGFTLFFWATATWWIPLLLILGVWRHVLQRVPIVYNPQYWSLVFPLGMYSVATFMLEKATGLAPLRVIPALFLYPALLAWALALTGLLRALAGQIAKPR
ncbi:MAG TPA: tellurite resistance/C4-dicarboxylate transporter family protein [Vicinamibacteria bacterium]|nr:tellurite resistance/C4-dicarboxylate transporter family protein [Vicinamibacteria bacterium]